MAIQSAAGGKIIRCIVKLQIADQRRRIAQTRAARNLAARIYFYPACYRVGSAFLTRKSKTGMGARFTTRGAMLPDQNASSPAR
ncbi:MAG: hypothetical protein DCC52_03750, partial [Chloroflexi bacterium]